MSFHLRVAALLLVLSCMAGCTAVTPAGPGERPVMLRAAQSRKCYGFVTAQIPAGKYEPAYKTADGTFYLCPTKIIWGYNPSSGGIFIPAASTKDQRQAVWLSDLGSTRLFKFEPALPIEYVNR